MQSFFGTETSHCHNLTSSIWRPVKQTLNCQYISLVKGSIWVGKELCSLHIHFSVVVGKRVWWSFHSHIKLNSIDLSSFFSLWTVGFFFMNIGYCLGKSITSHKSPRLGEIAVCVMPTGLYISNLWIFALISKVVLFMLYKHHTLLNVPQLKFHSLSR